MDKKKTNFKTTEGKIIHNVKEYVSDWMSNREDCQLFIGCDSQERGKTVTYIVTVCMYQKGKGGHFVIKKEVEPKINRDTRLWNEVEKSIQVADELNTLGKPITIHVDYNSNPKHMSNRFFDAGLGYIKGMGYNAEGKPFAWAASKSADRYTRT
jgi:predicted RNase H-related nuclease YkuK (DUF458 family)